jgi:hypothetical protein
VREWKEFLVNEPAGAEDAAQEPEGGTQQEPEAVA